MTPIRNNSSQNIHSFINKRTHEVEISHRLLPQRNKKTIEYFDAESKPLRASKIPISSVQMYLRIKPASAVTKEGEDIYRIFNPTILVTKFPSFEGNGRNSRSAKSGEATVRRHAFTKIFGSETSQAEMFERSIKHRVVDFLGGKSSTIMTYGTRDSGKTYTLFGTSASPGIIPRAIELVFSAINCTLTPWYKPTCRDTVLCLDEAAQTLEARRKTRVLNGRSMDVSQISAAARRSLENSQPGNADPEDGAESMYAVWLSFAEIYNGNIYDLLDDAEIHSPLRLTVDNEGRTYIYRLQRVHVISALEACRILVTGQSRMSTAATPSNPKSSRSHVIFTIKLLRYQKDRAADEAVLSTLTFCDLAGSMQFETHQKRSHMREASNINNSLLVLCRCLKAVSQNRQASFRESKLTRIFQHALSGQENLSFIVNVAFTPNLYVDTQNTLKFCTIIRKLLIGAHERCKRSCEFEKTGHNPEVCDSDVIASPSIHQTLSEITDTNDYDSVGYKNVQEQNQKLMKELETTKSDILSREYAIRQELADHYLRMIEELEATYRQHTKEIETEQHDLLKWSVKQVENFYKERIDNLMRHKKRKRKDSGDYIEDNRTLYEELEAENAQVTSKVVVLKETVKKLMKENKAILCEKNKCSFELALVTEELNKFRRLARVGIRKWNGDSENIEDDADCLMSNLERLMDERIRRTEKKLEETNEYVRAMRDEDAENTTTTCTSSNRSSKNDSGVSSGQDGSRRSTNISDSTHIGEKEDKYTQTCVFDEDSHIVIENIEQFKTCADSKGQNHKEMAELSQDLETIREMIHALNEAALKNERKIIQHELLQLHKKDALERLAQEEREIAIKRDSLSEITEYEVQEYKREIHELTHKITVNDENENQTSEYIEKYIDRSKIFETELSLTRDQLDKISNKCVNEHLPRIESLEEEVLQKTLRINELSGNIAEMQHKFANSCELFEKIHGFEIILDKWQRDKNALCRKLYDCSESQLILEGKLKKLTIKIAERESEITSLRSKVHNVEDLNIANSEKARNLSKRITEGDDSISSTKETLQCCEDLRKNMENIVKMEIDNFKSRFSSYKNNTALFRKIYDDSQDEVTRLKMLLQHKELEITLLKNNRDATIQKYEILMRHLQNETEEKDEQSKSILDESNNSEQFYIKNSSLYDAFDFLKKVRPINDNQKQLEKSSKDHDTEYSLTNNIYLLPKHNSESLDVLSTLNENSTISFDQKDDIKFDDIKSFQTNNVKFNMHSSIRETDNSETEDMKSPDTKDETKMLDWTKVRRIQGKTALL